MSVSVTMPALGESVTEGTITRWLKQEGETVEVDEPLLEVSTDKVDTEIPSPAAGVLSRIVAAEDETVDVGGELAVIGDQGDDNGGSSEPAASSDSKQDETAEAPEPAASADASASNGESTTVPMPALGESVTEGTVTRWLKSVGDTIEVDEAIVEVSTDKVDTEIPSPVAGTLLELKAEEDETVEVGGALAVIGSGSSSGAAAPAPKPEPESEPEPQPAAPKAEEKPAAQPAHAQSAPAPSAAPVRPSSQNDSVYVTPLVRKLANEKGVDLSQVTGTGV
ncbi:MAG TPA: E3 binding domain-containing protein, partial [Candidatus Stackebrandtia faecavium]|nr:E3 binding domain-containing protein [Candidatus Stackebrandtia faecavium]